MAQLIAAQKGGELVERVISNKWFWVAVVVGGVVVWWKFTSYDSAGGMSDIIKHPIGFITHGATAGSLIRGWFWPSVYQKRKDKLGCDDPKRSAASRKWCKFRARFALL